VPGPQNGSKTIWRIHKHEIRNQVCSLNLAKRLKELGVKQESYANWIEADEIGVFPAVQLFELAAFTKPIKKLASAFTVAELGEMLPGKFDEWQIATQKEGEQWCCFASDGNDFVFEYAGEADTEADARAKMLIYLLEHGLISPNEKSSRDR